MSKNAGKTVAQILQGKMARIKYAPLEPGSPSWDDILHLTWEDIVARKRQHQPGFKTFHKLLTDGDYDK